MTSRLFNQSCSCIFQHVYKILSESGTLRHNFVYKLCYINPSVDYKYNISIPSNSIFKKLKEKKNTHKISTLTFTLVISTILCTFRISRGSTGITQGQAVPFIYWWIPSGHWITFSQKFFIIHGTNQWTIVFTSVRLGCLVLMMEEKKLTKKQRIPKNITGKKNKQHTLSLRG